MKSFDMVWEKIHATQEWGKYPSEPVIRFVARNYGKMDRDSIKILDFGCGGGSHTWYLAREGFDVYAFDGSKSAVRKVGERLGQEGLAADLRVRDALELDYEEGFFDCVIDNATICANRYQNIIQMYSEIHKLLKKDKNYQINMGGGENVLSFIYH
jgi:2-polyprenyl-3-methyl-5-hydroxy-6-metoxy-1,4-benzoquinol methylase